MIFVPIVIIGVVLIIYGGVAFMRVMLSGVTGQPARTVPRGYINTLEGPKQVWEHIPEQPGRPPTPGQIAGAGAGLVMTLAALVALGFVIFWIVMILSWAG